MYPQGGVRGGATRRNTSRRAFIRTSILAGAAAVGCRSFSMGIAKNGSERQDSVNEYRDEKTGARVRMLVSGTENDQVTYQTHPMWTPGMRHLLFLRRIGDRTLPHAIEMKTRDIRCLVDGPTDDWTLHRAADRFYFRQGNDIFVDQIANVFRRGPAAEKVGAYDKLAEINPISMSLDADGDVLFVGVTIEKDKRWGIAALDLKARTYRLFIEVDFKVGHVQANPVYSGVVMFCHETGGDAPQRTWVVRADGTGMRPFYKETYDEWVTHEVWWGKDRAAFTIWPYDDVHRQKPHGIASADYATGTLTVHSQFPAWHTHGSPDGKWLVADDFDRSIWLIKSETSERRLLTQGHNGKGFDTHPHPSFTLDSKAVVFNSSRNQSEDVFLAEIPAWETLPKT